MKKSNKKLSRREFLIALAASPALVLLPAKKTHGAILRKNIFKKSPAG